MVAMEVRFKEDDEKKGITQNEYYSTGEGEGAQEDFESTQIPLTEELASECLTCVGPTYRIVNKARCYAYPTYAYLGMDVIGRGITDISVIPIFSNVIFLDLTNNKLNDDSLKPLEQIKELRTLVIDNNLVQSVTSVPDLPCLQLLSVKQNCLTSCEVRTFENLLYLTMSYNNIDEILPYLWCPYLLPKIQELSLRGNHIRKLSGFLFTNLVSLFLAENKITKIENLQLLPNLKFLHLRKNPLRKLDGFTAENSKLFYINIRDCMVRKESHLKKLGVLPNLARLVVLGNPFWDVADNARLKVISMLPHLQRINKENVSEEERAEAGEMAAGWDERGDDDDNEEKEDA